MLIEGLLGSITGMVGSTVGGWFKYKDRKLQIESQKIQNEHDIAMVKVETQAMVMEAKANIKVAQTQVEGAIELKDADAFIQAQKEGNKDLFDNKWIDGLLSVEGKWRYITFPIASSIAFLFGFVDFIKGLVRPSLTIYLCIISTYITWMAWDIMQKNGLNISGSEAVNIFKDVTSVVLYLTVSAITFWFGDRRISKNILDMKVNDDTKLNNDI